MLLINPRIVILQGTGSQVTPGFPHSQICLRVASPNVQEHGHTTPMAYELASDTYYGLGIVTVVASFISVSIQGLQQNPQDTSNFYLANLYHATIAGPNQSNISSSLPASPPPFSPPTYAVWVNSLWFLSLV